MDLDDKFIAIQKISKIACKFGGVILENHDIPRDLWIQGFYTQSLNLNWILHDLTRKGEIPVVFEPEHNGPYTMFYPLGTRTGNFEQIAIPMRFPCGIQGWRLATREDFEKTSKRANS